ncbi:DUF808 domain-containing protein [Corynebacterium sp. 335C]
MSGGLVALLDDVALIARSAAASIDDVGAAAGKVGMKAAGVVVDDAAVTPRYVAGVKPARELPIIWRITKGSLVNKLAIILPIALLLSAFAPWALTPILMVGGTYLCYEGAEKIWAKVSGHGGHSEPVAKTGPGAEDKLVKSAITTDFILSAEIMVISLNELTGESVWRQAIVLIVVAIAITLLVYGAVALLVKMDDVGLHLGESESGALQALGRGLVAAMPKILTLISVIGVFAMLWVGGHILLAGVDELGWHAPYGFVHHLAESVPGGFLSWLVDTACSMVVGIVWGAIIVAVTFIPPLKGLIHGGDEKH